MAASGRTQESNGRGAGAGQRRGGGTELGGNASEPLRTFDPHRERNGRSDDADAFMADPGEGPARIDDDFAESFAEDFVRAATTGQELGDESADAMVEEELGGPFVQTSATEEFGEYSSVPPENLPDDWAREALPQAVSGLVETPQYDDDARAEDDEDDELSLLGGDGESFATGEAEDYTGPNPPRRPATDHGQHASRR